MSSRQSRFRVARMFGLALLAICGTIAAAPKASVAGGRACADGWTVAPILPITWGGLFAVAVSSETDAWVAGTYGPTLEHFDGSAWTFTDPVSFSTWIDGIAAIDPTDAWAVGAVERSVRTNTAFITRWDGTSWTRAQSPGGLGFGELQGVSAVASEDVWTVGFARDETLTEHWDGSSWSVVPSRNKGTLGSYLQAVSTDGPDDAWAVGEWLVRVVQGPGQIRRDVYRPLILHWDGVRWARVKPPAGLSALSAVAAIAQDDAWAVGSADSRTVAIHWDGESWTTVPTPSPGVSAGLGGVADLGPSDVWAVGNRRRHLGDPTRTLIERWDGVSWQVVPSPNVGTDNNGLVAISAVPGRLLAVGSSADGDAGLALERCSS